MNNVYIVSYTVFISNEHQVYIVAKDIEDVISKFNQFISDEHYEAATSNIQITHIELLSNKFVI